MTHPTDHEVLIRVQQGEHSAYLIVFDRYYARIERYARRLLQDVDGARKAASSTFQLAFQYARRNRSDTLHYPALLFRICRRKILREFSPGSTMARPLFDSVEAETSSASGLEELPLDVILRADRDALIQSAMDRLLFADREILHLAFEPDLDPEDIGAILRQPSTETVTALVSRALRRLANGVLQEGNLVTKPRRKPADRVKHVART